jgi:hypothetical protein
MSANVPASSGAGAKAAVSARTAYRLILAVSLTALLSGAAMPARSQDGPMASAPLPPPLPAAPPATVLQQPPGEPSPATQRVLPRSLPPTASGVQAGNSHDHHNDVHHGNHIARAARGQKRPGERTIGKGEHRETHSVPQVASALTPPPAPVPFHYGYIPGAPPVYGYAPVYPPPWRPGPMLPR